MTGGTGGTAVILTALGLEYAAVREHLEQVEELKEREARGTLYEIGTFTGRRGTWTVAVAETGEGNATAGVQLERAVQAFSPQVVLFVGVAGGRKDVQLGDVVAADAVYDYEAGKDTQSRYLPRIKTAAPSYRLVQHARAVARRGRWQQRIKPAPPQPPPAALVKPIATGGKVVAHDRSRTARLIARSCGDALAVDMESYGFLHGAYTNEHVSALVVRGISDLLTGKNEGSDRQWQPVAARHAAAFAFELLADLRPMPDSGTGASPSTDDAHSLSQSAEGHPNVFNAPPRSAHFTGRDELLNILAAQLDQHQTGAIVQAGAIHGLGGVGKTQLAIEYAHRRANHYGLIWWLPAEESVTLASRLAALARQLGVPDHPNQDFVLAGLWAKLSRSQRWLLIYDNADSPEMLDGYRPPVGNGHILITSRNPAWQGIAQPIPIDVLSRAESVAFLLSRTRSTDEATAAQLADLLGDLPLALEQAAAYIDETANTILRYLSLFRDRARDLLQLGQPTSYPHTVAVTFSLALQQARARVPAAGELLCLLSFLSADDVPRSLVADHATSLPESLAVATSDPLSYDQALATLARLALIKLTPSSIGVHRLVQAVTRHTLAPVEAEQWASAAIRLLYAAFPSDSHMATARSACSELLPHALTAIEHSRSIGVESVTSASLLNLAGSYLWSRSELHQAQALLESALEIREKELGPNHSSSATSHNNLGLVLLDMGDLQNARNQFQRAVDIYEADPEQNHGALTAALTNLGRAMLDLGDLESARNHFQHVLNIREAELEPDDPLIAATLTNLGPVERALGDLQTARQQLERALTIRKNRLGYDHPYTATTLNNLGLTLTDLGDLQAALESFQDALAIYEAKLGPDHPHTAAALKNLGSVHRDLGKLDVAREYFRRALVIREKALGRTHPETERIRAQLVAIQDDSLDQQ